ncbi:hypothetical protein KAU40_01730 [Candidatus Parcubacteria bacterium]|nr:hypothetical protein [Candidatus Parcubacteria bacterium]
MKTKLNPISVLRELKKKKIKIFNPLEFERVFGVSKYAVQWFLKNQTKKGFFLKLKNGLYTLSDNLPPQYLIANRLYEPSYISFDTALAFYNIIPETIYTIISATPKITRAFEINKVKYEYWKIKQEAYTGYRLINYLDDLVLMAEPEKALADFLYFVVLRQREFHYERLDLEKVKKNKVLFYAKLFKKPEIIKIIEKIYADAGKPQRIY